MKKVKAESASRSRTTWHRGRKEQLSWRSQPGLLQEEGQAYLMIRKSEDSGLVPLYFLGAQNMLEVTHTDPLRARDLLSWSCTSGALVLQASTSTLFKTEAETHLARWILAIHRCLCAIRRTERRAGNKDF